MGRSLVALTLPRRIGDFIAFAQSVAVAMAAHEELYDPPLPLARYRAHVDELFAAEARTYQRTLGLTAQRDAAKAVVRTDLETLRAHVQRVADARGAAAPA